ncbi:MAG: hypothetical protein ACTSW1_07755 [Candidatus Hodarchaeales archaeon]
MKRKKKCPCIDCICVAICRNKPFYKLFLGCSIAEAYHRDWRVVDGGKHSDVIFEFQEALNPTEWFYNFDLDENYKYIPIMTGSLWL